MRADEAGSREQPDVEAVEKREREEKRAVEAGGVVVKVKRNWPVPSVTRR